MLTVARMLPVAGSMIGTDLPGRDRLFLGWVGPRGMASLVFGLLAYIDPPGRTPNSYPLFPTLSLRPDRATDATT